MPRRQKPHDVQSLSARLKSCPLVRGKAETKSRALPVKGRGQGPRTPIKT